MVAREPVLDFVHHTLLLMLLMLHRHGRASRVSCCGGFRGGYMSSVLVLVLVLSTSQLLLYLGCQSLLPSPTLSIILRLQINNKNISTKTYPNLFLKNWNKNKDMYQLLTELELELFER